MLNTYPSNPWPLSTEQKGGGGGSYKLPIASAETLGGVMVGEGLEINAETGVLSTSGGDMHTYSLEEQEVGVWIDGSKIYEKTFILRENGVDKYAKGGYQSCEYLIGLTGCKKVWIRNLWSDRTDTTDFFTDSRNLSGEVITCFDRSTGGVFVYNSHAPANVFVVLDYIKNESEE